MSDAFNPTACPASLADVSNPRGATYGVPRARDQSDPQRIQEWERIRCSVGSRIRELRIAKGMTQEGLALKSGLSRNLLVDVELGKSGLLYERLFDLAAALEVSPSEFLVVTKEINSH